MQKWEYRIEHDIPSDDTLEKLNALGEEGWELCGGILTTKMITGAKIDYCFKRPKESPPQSHLQEVESEGLESR